MLTTLFHLEGKLRIYGSKPLTHRHLNPFMAWCLIRQWGMLAFALRSNRLLCYLVNCIYEIIGSIRCKRKELKEIPEIVVQKRNVPVSFTSNTKSVPLRYASLC